MLCPVEKRAREAAIVRRHMGSRSTADIAAAVGVHQRTVQEWLACGTDIPGKHWDRLARALGTTVSSLLIGAGRLVSF